MNVIRFRTSFPGQGHQRTEASRLIVMMVRNKNRSNLSDFYTSLRNTARGAVTGINDIMHPVDGQQLHHCTRSGRNNGPAAVRSVMSDDSFGMFPLFVAGPR